MNAKRNETVHDICHARFRRFSPQAKRSRGIRNYIITVPCGYYIISQVDEQ
jgi:hypothetical protein